MSCKFRVIDKCKAEKNKDAFCFGKDGCPYYEPDGDADQACMCRDKTRLRRVLASGPYIELYAVLDENFKLYIEASAEDFAGPYYPKFCPECGRKLAVP